MLDLRSTAKHSRDPLPVGSIVVRHRRKRRAGMGGAIVTTPCRWIKVREDAGRRSERWERYATWWWKTNRGPVPAGMRVAHLDGDTLNDDPANLGLVRPGDIAFIARLRDPSIERRNRRNAGRATAAHNRLRAELARLRTWLPTRWYAVDPERRAIWNAPHDGAWRLYAAHGCAVTEESWSHAEPASLGYAGLMLLDACLLAVLVDAGAAVGAEELLDRAFKLRTRRRWLADFTLSSAWSALHRLRKHGLLCSVRSGRGEGSRYWSTPAARATRTTVFPFVAVRGRDLALPEFAGFERVNERGEPYARELARPGALLEEVSGA